MGKTVYKAKEDLTYQKVYIDIEHLHTTNKTKGDETMAITEETRQSELYREITAEFSKSVGVQMMERMKVEQAQKVRNFRTLNAMAEPGGILFTGSSLMEQFPVVEMAVSAGVKARVYNRGIGGTTTDDFLREIDTVLLDVAPSKVFINIGTNDMTDRVYGDAWKEHLEANYEKILQIAKEKIPEAEIYCMAYYPTNHHLPDQNEWTYAMLKDRTKENIAECSARVKALAEKYGYHYIDVNEGLYDEIGEQKKEYAIDGVHMIAEAYKVVFENLKPYLPL